MKKLLIPTVLTLLALSVQADDHRKTDESSHPSENYILRRQEAGHAEGVPTIRRIIGKREIDSYRDYRTGATLWFEGDHVVGVTR